MSGAQCCFAHVLAWVPLVASEVPFLFFNAFTGPSVHKLQGWNEHGEISLVVRHLMLASRVLRKVLSEPLHGGDLCAGQESLDTDGSSARVGGRLISARVILFLPLLFS